MRKPSPSRSIGTNPPGLGIIGFGGFGPFLLKAFSTLERAEVRCVADIDPGRRPDPPVRFTTSWNELVRDPEVDIVSVATPPSTHAEIAVAAMEAGKAVLIDKPLATTLEDAGRVIAARDRTGSPAAVNFMLRFDPLVEILEDWGRRGVFGRLRRADVENVAQDDSLPPDHWFWKREVSGGILVEHAVHFLDLVDHVAARRPVEVHGAHRMRNDSQEDQVLVTALYEGGLIATHYHEFSRPLPLETTSIRLVFDLAQVDLEGWIPLKGRIRALLSEEREPELRRLPGLKVHHRSLLSRKGGPVRLTSAGVPFEAHEMVEATFALPGAKSEVYQSCLRAMMDDLARARLESGHRVRVPLEDGLAALETALTASRDAWGEVQPPG